VNPADFPSDIASNRQSFGPNSARAVLLEPRM
jgi:hypothetical protein